MAGGLWAQDGLLDDVDAILAAISEANGGAENLESVRSLRVVGTIGSAEETYDFALIKKRPSKVRMTIMYKGRVVESGYNGEQAWRRVTVGTQEQVQDIEMDEFGLEIDFDGPLMGEAVGGEVITFEGTQREGRLEYYILKVLRPSGDYSLHHIDTRTFREARVEYFTAGETVPNSVSHFEDYFQERGVWFARLMRRVNPDGVEETVKISGLDMNAGIFNSSFEKPAYTRIPESD